MLKWAWTIRSDHRSAPGAGTTGLIHLWKDIKDIVDGGIVSVPNVYSSLKDRGFWLHRLPSGGSRCKRRSNGPDHYPEVICIRFRVYHRNLSCKRYHKTTIQVWSVTLSSLFTLNYRINGGTSFFQKRWPPERHWAPCPLINFLNSNFQNYVFS